MVLVAAITAFILAVLWIRFEDMEKRVLALERPDDGTPPPPPRP
jgi:hypothetical protein